jgi:hypothetical protein
LRALIVIDVGDGREYSLNVTLAAFLARTQVTMHGAILRIQVDARHAIKGHDGVNHRGDTADFKSLRPGRLTFPNRCEENEAPARCSAAVEQARVAFNRSAIVTPTLKRSIGSCYSEFVSRQA